MVNFFQSAIVLRAGGSGFNSHVYIRFRMQFMCANTAQDAICIFYELSCTPLEWNVSPLTSISTCSVKNFHMKKAPTEIAYTEKYTRKFVVMEICQFHCMAHNPLLNVPIPGWWFQNIRHTVPLSPVTFFANISDSTARTKWVTVSRRVGHWHVSNSNIAPLIASAWLRLLRMENR